MTVETRETEIGGHKYELTLYGTREGQRVLFRLFKILGPAAAQLLSQGRQGIAPAITSVVQSASQADLDYLIDEFASKTKVVLTAQTDAGDKPVKVDLKGRYDQEFGRRYGDALAWLIWAITENYSDFLGDWVKDLFARKSLVRSGSKSPQGSTGSSGEST